MEPSDSFISMRIDGSNTRCNELHTKKFLLMPFSIKTYSALLIGMWLQQAQDMQYLYHG